MPRKRAEDANYRIIYKTLKNEIITHTFAPGKFLPTERELGERFGVDRITVRKSLQLLVDDGLVEKRPGVGTLVKNLNEYYSEEKQNNNILYVLPKSKITEEKITDVYNSEMFYYLQEEFFSNGYNLLYTSADDSSSLNSISNNNYFCGIIFVSQLPEKLLNECIYTKTPTLIVNNISENIPSIVSDNYGGVNEAIKHFYMNGHRNIGFVGGKSEHFNAKERLESFIKTMKELNLPINDRFIETGDWTFEGGQAAMKRMLSQPSIPTAILAANDMTALGLIACARENGIRIPEELSVIGFDNISHCNYCYPTLTSVNINFEAMAHVICSNLSDIIKEGNSFRYRVSVPVNLVERHSVHKMDD